MNIELYISQLLYRYQCVTIPGFGAFLTEIQSAQCHENTNGFYPPKKLISFNSFLKNNDGLLANHIAQNEKSTYETAVASIEIEVAKWKNELQFENTIALKNIGELSLNSEKNIIFSPFEQPNYLSHSFGLSSIIAPVIKREVLQHVFETFEDNEVIQLIAEKNQGRTYLKYAAIIVLSLSFSGIMGIKLYEDKVAADTLFVEKVVQEQVQNKIQKATFFIESPLPTVTLTVKEEKMPYHVVAGSFRVEENAERIYQKLRKEGFKARRLTPNNHGLFPVLYGSYSTFEEAQKERVKIRKTQNPDAWLLIDEI
ncbi:MAG: SPOR domain-containing protein [Flavobacteriaceae bacterium]|nr:SPOR domain-containing protein [Flavobacteriaceae bacterium]